MTNKLTKKLAVFDIDGTILDSRERMARELVWTAEQLGVNTDYNIALANYNKWSKFMEVYNITKSDFFNVKGQGKTWKESLESKEARLYKDTLPCLEELSQRGIILATLTKSKPEYTWEKINYFGLEKYFGDRVAISDVKSSSKLEDAKKLVSQVGLENISKAYFIGDQTGDVTIAPEIGQEFSVNPNGIWINREYSGTPQELINFTQINSLEELSKIILSN
ncbi:HAD family hydrolase [Candidatus Pacearchaeota archaeon]|nr:HAD family hydrolase [Candidatus Pacearchaeota archaeon]